MSFLPLCYESTSRFKVKNGNLIFLVDSGRILTLDLRITSWVFYHCAAIAQAGLKLKNGNFSSLVASGRIQTLDLRIASWVFYHCARTQAGFKLKMAIFCPKFWSDKLFLKINVVMKEGVNVLKLFFILLIFLQK